MLRQDARLQLPREALLAKPDVLAQGNEARHLFQRPPTAGRAGRGPLPPPSSESTRRIAFCPARKMPSSAASRDCKAWGGGGWQPASAAAAPTASVPGCARNESPGPGPERPSQPSRCVHHALVRPAALPSWTAIANERHEAEGSNIF